MRSAFIIRDASNPTRPASLHHSPQDEKRFHDEAAARLMAENTRFQNRIEGMNLDKLDGKIPMADFEQKAAKWRAEQDRLQGSIEEHLAANQPYLQEGVRLLKLAQCAHELFRRQEPREKRRLLNFVPSNRTWVDEELQATFRQLFDMIADSNVSHGHKKEAAGDTSDGLFANWLPALDAFRNFCFSPQVALEPILSDIGRLSVA